MYSFNTTKALGSRTKIHTRTFGNQQHPRIRLFKSCMMASFAEIRTRILLFCLLLLLQHPVGKTISWASATSLTPPPGNSILIKTKAINGVYFYRCIDGDWLIDSASASLVDIENLSSIVGNYSFVYRPLVPRHAGTWTLFNSDGDTAESGSPVSRVSGKRSASVPVNGAGHLNDFLAEVSRHKSHGAATQISYISRVSTKGGVAPNTGYCEADDKIARVVFQAEFWVWRQDVVPPVVPLGLAIPDKLVRPVENFFAKGVVKYVYNGATHNWTQQNTVAKLYDVPGSPLLGIYYIRSKSDKAGGAYCWNMNNPDGFEIVGKHACKPVFVSPDCLPWSLNAITSRTGNISSLGPYTYVHMVSTSGGLPPSPSTSKPTPGKVWKSQFTAIFWFYCSM